MADKERATPERAEAEEFLRSQGLDMEVVETSIKQTAEVKAKLKRRGRIASRGAEAAVARTAVEVLP